MIGYHYTSYKNWLDIRENGLQPYPITKKEFRQYHQDNPETVNAVWLWERKFRGRPHIGAILYQFSTKNDTKIVWLECEWFYIEQLFIKDKDGEFCPVELGHDGMIGNAKYHNVDHHKSRLITKPIPPQRIKLLKTYDLQELLK